MLIVPSLLALLGERVNALSLRRGPAVSDESGGWYRLARGVMRHPVAVALSTSALLLLLAVPMLGVNLTVPGTDTMPKGKPSRDVVVTINRDYPTTLGTPVPVVVDGPASRAQLRRLSRRIAAIDDVSFAVPFRRVAPNLAVASFGLSGGSDDALSEEAQEAVRSIRAAQAPAPLLVSGYTAEFLDLKTSLGQEPPTRDRHHRADHPDPALHVDRLGGAAAEDSGDEPADPGGDAGPHRRRVPVGPARRRAGATTAPRGWRGLPTLVLMFAVIFGLSTDYAVLVLARIKELHDSGLPNEEAVARGIARTGRGDLRRRTLPRRRLPRLHHQLDLSS